jgi:hypothetical protein
MNNTIETINGTVMTFDEQGRMISRRGGLFWDMDFQYDAYGNIMHYSNSLGYNIKGYFWVKLNRWHLEWKVPIKDVFQISLRLNALKKTKQ